MASGEYSIERFEAPLPAELISELSSLWQVVYGREYQNELPVHAGEEEQYNHNIYYLIRNGGNVVSTAHATVCRNDPRLGGLTAVRTGHVAWFRLIHDFPPSYKGGRRQRRCQTLAQSD